MRLIIEARLEEKRVRATETDDTIVAAMAALLTAGSRASDASHNVSCNFMKGIQLQRSATRIGSIERQREAITLRLR